MSVNNNNNKDNQNHSRKISFSEKNANKDLIDLFQSNELEQNTVKNTNLQNFQPQNLPFKDLYFNFNLKTLSTDSIEDIQNNRHINV